VRKSVADPVFDAKENIVSTLVLLEAAREHGVRKVLFSSSGGAGYGEQEYFPRTKSTHYGPFPPMGGEGLRGTLSPLLPCPVRAGIHGIAVLETCYGPRQDPHGEAGVVAIFCERLLKGQTALVNGDGLQTRDYVYVGDVVARQSRGPLPW